MTLKPVDTAIIMVVGPCIDDTDFKTLEEGIAYNAAGMDISLIIEKTDGTSTTTAITLTTGGTSDWTHKDGGYYEVEITAAQNAEEGIAYLRGVCTGVLPFESSRYEIVKANIYDSWIKGTDTLQTDVTHWRGWECVVPNANGVPAIDIVRISGDSTAADNLELDYDGTGYNKSNSTIGTTTTNTDMITDMISVNPLIPYSIDLANTANVRIGLGLTNMVDDLPTTAEITPGTIHIYRKAIGGTSWINKVNGSACTELDGLIYYDEVFDNTTGYAAGDSIHIKFSNQKITVDANDFEITGTNGWVFQTHIRESMVGTTGANTITPPTVIAIREEMDSNSTKMAPSQVLADYKATGFSTHSAGDIWSVGTRALTDKSNFGLSTASINLIWDDLISGITQVGSIGKLIADNLNATITSRAIPNEYDTQMGYIPSNLSDVPTATELNSAHGAGSWATATGFSTHSAGDIWSIVTRSLTDKSGFSLSTAGIKAIWDQLTSALTTVGSLGKLLVDNINATISSRSPSGEYDTEIAHLDADISSRNAIPPNIVIPDAAGIAATLHGITDGKINVMDAIVDAIKAKTDNLPSGITKNEALPKFAFLMVLSSDHITGATGKTITGTISKDGGSFTAITNTITEVSNGMYTIASGFTQTEMNADVITLQFSEGTCDTRIITLLTN